MSDTNILQLLDGLDEKITRWAQSEGTQAIADRNPADCLLSFQKVVLLDGQFRDLHAYLTVSRPAVAQRLDEEHRCVLAALSKCRRGDGSRLAATIQVEEFAKTCRILAQEIRESMKPQAKVQVDLVSVIRDKAFALAKQPRMKQGLRDAVAQARSRQPRISEWIKPYVLPQLKRLGIVKEECPSHAVDDTTESLLDCVLAAIAYDSFIGPDKGKISFDFHGGPQADWTDLEETAYQAYRTLSEAMRQPDIYGQNDPLLRRILDAVESLEAGQQAVKMLETEEQAAEKPNETRPAGETQTRLDGACCFRRKGDVWEIRLDGQETNVKDSKGMMYIHYLVKNTGTPIECRDIERACSKDSPEGGRRMDSEEAMDADLHTSGYDLKQLDDWDAEEIWRAKDQLEEKMQVTDDPGMKDEIKDQIRHLGAYLRKNMDRRGGARPVDEKEKTRSRVQKAINTAKKCILACDPQLGSHFDAIRPMGNRYVYRPGRHIAWILE